MKIGILRDLGIFDASSITSIQTILDRIKAEGPVLELDFSRCLIDYPATSKIVDKAINELLLQDGERKLSIHTNLNIREDILLLWFFVGSEFFDLSENDKSRPLYELRQIIRGKLDKNNIDMNVIVIDKTESAITTYEYK